MQRYVFHVEGDLAEPDFQAKVMQLADHGVEYIALNLRKEKRVRLEIINGCRKEIQILLKSFFPDDIFRFENIEGYREIKSKYHLKNEMGNFNNARGPERILKMKEYLNKAVYLYGLELLELAEVRALDKEFLKLNILVFTSVDLGINIQRYPKYMVLFLDIFEEFLQFVRNL